jgi:hypothetical protein
MFDSRAQRLREIEWPAVAGTTAAVTVGLGVAAYYIYYLSPLYWFFRYLYALFTTDIAPG